MDWNHAWIFFYSLCSPTVLTHSCSFGWYLFNTQKHVTRSHSLLWPISVNSTTHIVCRHRKPSPILTSQLSLNVPYLSWWASPSSIIWDKILHNQTDSPLFLIPMHNQLLFANHFSNVSPSHQPWDSHLLKLSPPPNLASLYHVVFRVFFLIFNSFLWVPPLTPPCCSPTSVV